MATWIIELVTNEFRANIVEIEADSVVKVDYQTLIIDGEKLELPEGRAGLSFARVAPRITLFEEMTVISEDAFQALRLAKAKKEESAKEETADENQH